MSERPLLSICIPTYNRARILGETLTCFVQNPEFDDDVEIVISDNCSTDDTGAVARMFSEKYRNVRYFRNEENVLDRNFIHVLDRAEGQYLKLLNDWVYMDVDSLLFMKQRLREHLDGRRPVFFTNGWLFTKRKQDVVDCTCLDEYIQTVSTFVTCNSIFGVWRDDWQRISDKDRYASYKIMQVDWSYQIASMGRGCIIYDRCLLGYSCEMRNVVRSGYNWFQIHLDNYYRIMSVYRERGLVSDETMRRDSHYLLEHFAPEFCQIFLCHSNKKWQYATEGTWRMLMKYYKRDSFFYLFLLRLPLKWLLHKHVRNNG